MTQSKNNNPSSSNNTQLLIDLLELATINNLNVEVQKSWYKITNNNIDNRKAVYVAKSKKVVTKIHFSGFTPEACEGISLLSKEDAKELRLGAVRGELSTKDTELNAEQITEAFSMGLKNLLDETVGFKFQPKPAIDVEVVTNETVTDMNIDDFADNDESLEDIIEKIVEEVGEEA